MPKPGGRQNWKKNYNEHDDRDETHRRTNFKPRKFNKPDFQKDWARSIRAHLEDEDVDMGSTSAGGAGGYKKNFNHKRGGGSGGAPGGKGNFRAKLYESPTGWYRVVIPYGHKYEKSTILSLLLENMTPLTFSPIMWTVNGTTVSFYLDEAKAAQKLHTLNKQIQAPDGFKLVVRVFSGTPHNVELTPAIKEKMKVTMASRYNVENKSLDLTRFHADPQLHNVFCALFKPHMLLVAIDIIADNIPQLEALNLQENNIQVLSHLRKLHTKLSHLKILHIGKNKLKDMAALDSLTGLPIVDLVLDGNPLCDKFKDKDTYISEVRKRFPKVLKLDGLVLPPRIDFDISEEMHLPPPQRMFICNVEGQEIATRFLNQFIQVFDSDSRQPLLQAYHEKSLFSMTSCYAYGQHNKNTPWLNWYNTDSRNLLRVQDPERRQKLLRQGHLAIVSFLAEMPTTKHDLNSFTFDLNFFSPQMLLVSVSGLFKELGTGQRTSPIRHFLRTWVIVPAGSGLCIANEELHITNATEQQMKKAFKSPEIAPATPIVPTSPPAALATPTPDDSTRQQMIETMAQQSGMNLMWSQKCLEESGWNFERAAFAFTELNGKGAVPSEAFLK